MKWLIVGLAGAAVLVATLGLALDRSPDSAAQPSAGPYRGSEPPARYELPRFSLRNYDGRRVDSGDLRGRIVVLTFLDSQCTDVCPILASQIAQTIEDLTAAERREVIAVAVSTDPAEDTTASVRTFLRNQRATGRLLYLTGSEPVMRSLWHQFQILASLESGEDTVHSAPVRIYDRESVWVATLHAGADLTPQNLAHDIRVALEARAEVTR